MDIFKVELYSIFTVFTCIYKVRVSLKKKMLSIKGSLETKSKAFWEHRVQSTAWVCIASFIPTTDSLILKSSIAHQFCQISIPHGKLVKKRRSSTPASCNTLLPLGRGACPSSTTGAGSQHHQKAPHHGIMGWAGIQPHLRLFVVQERLWI